MKPKHMFQICQKLRRGFVVIGVRARSSFDGFRQRCGEMCMSPISAALTAP